MMCVDDVTSKTRYGVKNQGASDRVMMVLSFGSFLIISYHLNIYHLLWTLSIFHCILEDNFWFIFGPSSGRNQGNTTQYRCIYLHT